MHRISHIVFWIVTASLFMTCQSNRTVTQQAPEVNLSIRKAFLVIKSSPGDKIYYEALTREILSGLQVRGVQTGAYLWRGDVINRFEMDEINKKIKDFFPQVIVRVHEASNTGKTRGIRDDSGDNYLTVLINEYPEGPVLWQTYFDLKGKSITDIRSGAFHSIANQIIEVMEKDDLIPTVRR